MIGTFYGKVMPGVIDLLDKSGKPKPELLALMDALRRQGMIV